MRPPARCSVSPLRRVLLASLIPGMGYAVTGKHTDSLGTALLPGQAPAQVQYDVRPAGVLQIPSASPLSVQVKATGIGRVYVIAALGASLDSVAIQVQ